MTADYSIIANKERNTITILDIPLAFALLSKNYKLYTTIKYNHSH